jgi:hypothetical protein
MVLRAGGKTSNGARTAGYSASECGARTGARAVGSCRSAADRYMRTWTARRYDACSANAGARAKSLNLVITRSTAVSAGTVSNLTTVHHRKFCSACTICIPQLPPQLLPRTWPGCRMRLCCLQMRSPRSCERWTASLPLVRACSLSECSSSFLTMFRGRILEVLEARFCVR